MLRITRPLLPILVGLSLAACNPKSSPPPGPTGTADITVVSISDWHAQLDSVTERDSTGTLSSTYGGVGLLSTYFKAERAANPVTLVFTGGDDFGATPPLSFMFDDKPSAESLAFLKFDGDTFGNHDFDHGIAYLKSRIADAKIPFISTNLKNAATELGSGVDLGYRIYEVGTKDPKVKVAVMGVTNPDAPSLTLPGNLGSLTIDEPVTATNAAAAKARAAGAAVVVVLVHMGATSKDAAGAPTGPAIDFAKALTGVDVVLADHTDFAVNGTFGSALVIENRSKGRTYGKVQLKVVDGKLQSKTGEIVDPIGTTTAILATGATCPTTACPDASFTCTSGKCVKVVKDPDPDAEALIKPYRDQLSAKFDVKVGVATDLFVRDSGQAERLQEVPIGDLLAEAMLDRYKTSHGAQIAFTNGGGIRAPLPSSYVPQAGGLNRTAAPYDLVVGDIYTVLPFGNVCVVRKVTGQLLWQVLEKSVFTEPARFGGFLQIAGFKYTYSIGAAAGARVQSVTLLDGSANGKDIPSTDTTEYTLVTNDFTNAGGDGYSMLKQDSPSPGLEVIADVLDEYVKKHTPLTPSTDGRILQVP